MRNHAKPCESVQGLQLSCPPQPEHSPLRNAEQVAMRCLLAEIDLTMAVDGYPRVSELTRDALRRIGE
jgi:hypothetical protein